MSDEKNTRGDGMQARENAEKGAVKAAADKYSATGKDEHYEELGTAVVRTFIGRRARIKDDKKRGFASDTMYTEATQEALAAEKK
jgi:hypothetical protein